MLPGHHNRYTGEAQYCRICQYVRNFSAKTFRQYSPLCMIVFLTIYKKIQDECDQWIRVEVEENDLIVLPGKYFFYFEKL